MCADEVSARNTHDSLRDMVYLWTITFGIVARSALRKTIRRARQSGAKLHHVRCVPRPLEPLRLIPSSLAITRGERRRAPWQPWSGRNDHSGKKTAPIQTDNKINHLSLTPLQKRPQNSRFSPYGGHKVATKTIGEFPRALDVLSRDRLS
jgi:hypothetical protein